MAVTQAEEPRLLKLYERGIANGVKDLTLMDAEELKKIEPHCRVSMSLICIHKIWNNFCKHSGFCIIFVIVTDFAIIGFLKMHDYFSQLELVTKAQLSLLALLPHRGTEHYIPHTLAL